MPRNVNVQSVEHLDLERYKGLWFEIGRLPLRFADRKAQQAIGQAERDPHTSTL